MKLYTKSERGQIANFWLALLKFNKQVESYIPGSRQTTRRSFVLAIYVLPIFMARNYLLTSQAEEFSAVFSTTAGTIKFFVQMSIVYAASWMLWPALVSIVVPYLYPDKEKTTVFRYITAFCWLKGFEILVIGSLQLYLLATMTEDNVPQLAASILMVSAVAFLYYGWNILRRVLDISNLGAFGFMLQYLLVNLLLQQIVVSL